MSLNKSLNIKEFQQVILIGLAFVLINSVLLYFEFFYLPLIPILVVLGWLFFTSLDRALLLIVFLVPLSIKLSRILPDLGIDMALPTEPFLALIMILFFIKYFKKSGVSLKILRHPVSLALYINLAWIAITVITSSIPLVSIKFLVARIWFITSFYLLAAQMFENPSRIRQYIWVYVISICIVIIYVLVRHTGQGLNNQVASHWVVRPFYNDHTSYGAVLAMVIPVIIGMFFSYRKKDIGQNFLFILLIGLFIAATVFSYTRAAWVSLMGVFGVWVIVKLKIKFHIVMIGGVIVAGIFFSMWDDIRFKMEQNSQTSSGEFTEHIQSISNVRNDASNLERLNRWNSAIRMFKEKPVFGWGPGTYQFNYAPYQLSTEKTSISTNTGTRGNAHSEYLGPLSESGVLGMVTILLIIATSIITGLRVYRKARSSQIKIISLSVTLGLITYWIHGVLNNFLDTDKASALVWGYTAILVAMDIFHLDKEDEDLTPAGKLNS